NSGGVYHLVFTATNVVGSATQNFTLTVNQTPVIVSPNNATFTVGSSSLFTVSASGSPTPSLSKSGAFPTGVTFTDNGNGTATIGGTPSNGSGGTYALSFTATNPAGTDNQPFTIFVCNSLVVNNPGTSTGTANTPFSQTFTQTGGLGAVTFALNSGAL